MTGLYIHIPFCLQKCSYCDFVSFAGCDDEIQKSYVDAVVRELRGVRAERIDTVFIGGGTPTALSMDLLGQILSQVGSMHLAEDCEWTVEANPETITAEYAKGLRAYGVNRISMGLQSADNCTLKTIGRVHSFERFLNAFEHIRNAGFDNINVDLMYGLPNQDGKEFVKTVERVLSLEPEHISAYSLILNEGTPLYNAVQNNEFVFADEDGFNEGLALLESRYHRYEVSNYALENKECRHNINYWEYGSYYGIGVSASGALTLNEVKALGVDVKENCPIIRTKHTDSLSEYIKGDILQVECIGKTEAMFERIMVGLRMIRGISLDEFYHRFGVRLEAHIAPYIESHPELIKVADGNLRLTEKGLNIQNTVLVDLMDYFEY